MKKLISVKPMFNRIITTMDTYDSDQLSNGVLDPTRTKGTLKEYQTVVAVGSTVRDINVGDVVCIDLKRYSVFKHEDKSLKNGVIGDNVVVSYRLETLKLGDKEHLMLYDQDIKFVVLEMEDVPDPTIEVIKQKVIH